MIQGLSDFRWPRPLETDPSIRDRSKKCAFHKDHGHTTETCRSLQYLVERLIKAGHLKQYLRSDTGGRDASQHHNSGAPRAPVAPKAVINYINGGPSDEEYDSRRKRQKLLRAASIRERINSIRPGLTGEGPRPIDGTIIFPPAVQPIWCKHQSLAIWDIVSRVSKTPDESYPDSTDHQHILRRHYTAGRAGPVTLNVQFSVVQELSPFNVILGRTWLHYMKAIPSTYHQMVSFLTNEGQTDLYGSQLAARQCYQIAREAVANQRMHLPLNLALRTTNSNYWVRRTRIPREFIPHCSHSLTSFQQPDPSQKISAFTRIDKDIRKMINCWKPDSSEKYLIRIGKCSSGTKKEGKWRVCVITPISIMHVQKTVFPYAIDQIVDSTSGQGMLSFLDAFSGYHQIPMSPDDEEKTAFITPHGLYCYKVMPFGLKNAGATYQRLMTKIFKPLIGRSRRYLVKSKTREQHILHLQEVFLLRKYDMKLNPSKCAFGVSAGKFLGFMVSQRGIEVSPDQVKAVMETPPPRNKKELQRLTGKLVALGRFIARFTDELRPFFLAIRKAGTQGGRTIAKTRWKELNIVLCIHPS
ncbi:Transposon Ty3-G Gag-Pol polyprotein [Vitis vinifera]|uniref:Transposon Ty3-G Gag-Pol polyprotein n=1 Tax=Vitis vinifera TaxID=29760 RepID=A0A438E8A3_VITVI|nr:Transposon Ty3-G Gag-Pol polyprotein [Vitis vinifera]